MRGELHIEIPKRIYQKKIILDPSAVKPDRNRNGIDLAAWITRGIDDGYISVSGGDTHSFNTNLTTASSRSHTVTGGTWSILDSTYGGISIASTGVRLGISDVYTGFVNITAGGISIVALDGPTIRLGDPGGDENGTLLTVDDSNENISFASASITLPNHDSDTSGDATDLLVGVESSSGDIYSCAYGGAYADDTAAGVGGVAVGGLYYNTTNSALHTRMS